jgi:flagellar hook assembly protein FlgD
MPEEMKLHQNYPNPFNPETRIRFDIPTSSDVQVEVFDMTGRLVRTFASSRQEAGSHEIIWNAKDNAGAPVASGTYLYRLIVNGSASAKKMILLR